jgi:hypothetical protein
VLLAALTSVPAASATKLVLGDPGPLSAGAPLTVVGNNVLAGTEECAVVELTGSLITNEKPKDKMTITSGTASGCEEASQPITTVVTGFPWTLTLTHGGGFKTKATPRVAFVDTFAFAPFVCEYRSATAIDVGSFAVSTTPAPLELQATAWPFQPISPPPCASGTLTATFKVSSAGKPVEAKDL